MNVNSPDFIDEKQMNRAVLARQLLIDRAGASTPAVLEKMAGLQAQYAPSSYVGLWSRRLGMHRSDLDAALDDRSVIQGTLMRVTIHLASRDDYWLFAAGLRSARREMWLRLMKGQRTEVEMRGFADRTRTLLFSGPMKRTDLVKELGLDSATWLGVGLWVDLRRLVFHTKNPQSVNTFLVDGSVAGTWRNEKGRVVVEPFEPPDPAVRREIDGEAERLEAFVR